MGKKRPRAAVGIAFFAIAAAFFSQGKSGVAAAFFVIGITFLMSARRGDDNAG